MSTDTTTNPLSLVDVLQNEGVIRLDRSRQVYCNRDLKFEAIEAIGFDMDYTLAAYVQEELDALSVSLTLSRLVEHRGYDPALLDIKPRPDFAIRGLVVDKEFGNIIKLDSHRHVGAGYHGFQPLTDAQRHAYRNETIRLTSDERYALIDTLFALPEAFMYAAIVDFLESRGETVDFHQLYDDIRFSIDLAHRDGSIKAAIMADIPRFIVKEPAMAFTLHKLRSAGKKIFLITNSFAEYTNALMEYLLDDVLKEYASWRSYFDIVITGSRKPGFFTKREPFKEVETNLDIVNENVTTLERGKIYQGGNVLDFEEMTGWGGESVCYVGDHIYGDIVRSKKSTAWRTIMIVQEMEAELEVAVSIKEDITNLHLYDAEVMRLNAEIAFDQNLSNRISELFPDDNTTAEAIEQARLELKATRDRMRRERTRLLDQIEITEKEIARNFNQFWGLIFKLENENTLFGEQVEDYACLYTSRVSNLLGYSPLHYFKSPRQLMPHERF